MTEHDPKRPKYVGTARVEQDEKTDTRIIVKE